MARLLGIDIGGTKLALAVGDETGRIDASVRLPMPLCGEPEQDLARVVEHAREVLGKAGAGAGDLAAVGVSAPGPLDAERGLILDPPNLPGWGRVPVRDHLRAALGVPVRIENDANAGALAEWHFGAGRGLSHVVYLTMSTGVGGGLILGGRLHRGVFSSAGEVGHMPIEWEGEPCSCGLRGCLEAYIGGRSWTRRLRAITPADSRVAALAGGREHARPEELVAAAREGDPFATAEMDRYNDYLARGLVALVFTVAPEAIVLGTIPTAAGEALCLRPVRERVARHVWPFLSQDLRIVPAALGDTLPFHAALSVALEELRG
ncbi:MAG: ROK family protein [Myxococcota bacterium]|nr:ROK family protein [Myxococcota bacterium]